MAGDCKARLLPSYHLLASDGLSFLMPAFCRLSPSLAQCEDSPKTKMGGDRVPGTFSGLILGRQAMVVDPERGLVSNKP